MSRNKTAEKTEVWQFKRLPDLRFCIKKEKVLKVKINFFLIFVDKFKKRSYHCINHLIQQYRRRRHYDLETDR